MSGMNSGGNDSLSQKGKQRQHLVPEDEPAWRRGEEGVGGRETSG